MVRISCICMFCHLDVTRTQADAGQPTLYGGEGVAGSRPFLGCPSLWKTVGLWVTFLHVTDRRALWVRHMLTSDLRKINFKEKNKKSITIKTLCTWWLHLPCHLSLRLNTLSVVQCYFSICICYRNFLSELKMCFQWDNWIHGTLVFVIHHD